MTKQPPRHMLSVDLETKEAAQRLEMAAGALGWKKSELARVAIATMLDYIETGLDIKGAGLIPAEKLAEINRLREIANRTRSSATRILRDMVDAIEPLARELGEVPHPLRLQAGPVDARAERIAGTMAVIRRNIRELESLLE